MSLLKNADPEIQLSSLRDIGWTEWDPIGLLPPDMRWDQENFADEYDTYLLKVVGDLRHGASLDEAIRYLLQIEREHMALGSRPGQEERAGATVRSIQRVLSEVDRRNSNPA